jgi:hypothetical protein
MLKSIGKSAEAVESWASVNDYQLKSSTLCQNSWVWITGSYPRLPKNLAGHKFILKLSSKSLQMGFL